MFKAEDHKRLFEMIVDHPRTFPKEVNQILKHIDLLKTLFVAPAEKSAAKKSETILDFLFELGRGNLAVGRIIEGHINALVLIDAFGSAQQKEKYFKCAEQGDLFGIWNTEIPKESVKLRKKGDEFMLEGIKSFCSGGLSIDFALVTAQRYRSSQMLLVDINAHSHLKEDWSLWNPIGMRASVSCRIDFTQTPVTEKEFLGKPRDYYLEPNFSWGGVRFSTVQLGGAQSIFDEVVKTLVKRKRTSDPYQMKRLGKMAILLETAKFWIAEAQRIENENDKNMAAAEKVNFANMMRSASLHICEEIIAIAEKAVGIQSTMIGSPLEQKIRDLRVYLKQAGPDAALASVGDFISKTKK